MRRKDREVTDRAAVLAIIESAETCRLGMVDDSGPVLQPYLVALNFGFEPAPQGLSGGIFWFHCARQGRKLAILRKNPQVCIQLDSDHEPVISAIGCGWGMKYASVVAMGRATLVEDPLERRRGLDCLMGHYWRLWGMPSESPVTAGATAVSGTERTLPMPSGLLDYDEKNLAITEVIRVDVESLTAKRKE